ncbi:MAG: Phosphoribosylamine glycine ligase, partial [Bacteroidota bacterium]
MNVLILGSGAREHTMAWKLSQSPENPHIYVAPGNAGSADVATNLPLSVTDFNGIAQAVHQFGIELVLVGPEDPLVLGISDFFAADPTLAHVPVIGPNKTAAQLEGSKQYAKEFLIRHGIPTAAYAAFTAETLAEGQAFLTTLKAPYVLKADGLAAGKGVLILSDLQEAQSAL